MIPVPEGWSPRSTADYYLHGGEPRGFGRAALVRALMSTSFVVNTGEDPLVGGSRPMTGTEANDVADLVFGAAPDREGSPFDLQVLDVEPRHEVQCPACGATIRARMADAPDDQGDDADDAHVLSEPRPSPKPDARGFWIVSCSCGYVTSPNPSAMRARKAAGDHLRAKTTASDDLAHGLPSGSVTTTPPQSGIDTCRHHPSPRVHPRYEIQESGHAPED